MRKKGLLMLPFVVILLHCTVTIDQPVSNELRPESVEKQVIVLINEVRVKGITCGGTSHGATRPVTWNDKLGQASLHHCVDMARRGSLSHSGFDYRLSKVGYRWITFGENVGAGFRTPKEAVRWWLKSKGHCENIMNPTFKEAGSAYAVDSGNTYWTLILAAPEF
jgi:uncharacterized protein YkwD